MQKDRWQKIEEIFKQAVALPQADRQKFIENICGDDIELCREIFELLDADTAEENVLDEDLFSLGVKCLNVDELLLEESEFTFYRIKKLLGRGGMGAVYLAEDTRLKRLVALKILPAALSENIEAVRRFRQEARAALAISHSNIAHIYDIGENGKMPFIAMEFVEGVTLRERLRDKTLSAEQAVSISLQTASALSAAHVKGIVHRDIKPEKIIIRPDGSVKIVDFGIAKLTPLTSSMNDTDHSENNQNQSTNCLIQTEPGMLMGTVSYMSPEQVRGTDIDARTDVWSLGVVLYEMIAEKKPFQGETTSDIIASILRNELPDLPLKTPTELSRVIKKSLKKSADNRYQSVNEFWYDLKTLEHQVHDYKISVDKSTEENPSSRITNENPDSRTVDDGYRQRFASADRQPIDYSNTQSFFQQVRPYYVPVALSLGLIMLVLAAKFSVIESLWRAEPPDTFQKMHLKKLTRCLVPKCSGLDKS